VVMIGTDSHKRTHTVVAVDEVGRRLGEKTVRTNSEGHLELVRWAARFTSRVASACSENALHAPVFNPTGDERSSATSLLCRPLSDSAHLGTIPRRPKCSPA